ncbi:MAG: class I mannose-6-phosphate isomerase [Verrucomicrobia bacterium]|nr:class I mannose-6-phosphate isomerase [Verrucomicrobiota bacterium]
MENCLTFEPIYQERVWGGQTLRSAFGRNLPSGRRIGESWELVDREEAQSVVNGGQFAGWTLHRLWTERREEIFGNSLSEHRFPILIKILDAADKLSVQVHPPAELAEALRGQPKSEVWYFIQTEQNAQVYAGLKKGVCREHLEQALADGTVDRLVHCLPTRTDSFIFIPSGRLHAIDRGNLIFEIQQNSDTTYRLYDWNRLGSDGKPRKLHVSESLACTDFEDVEPVLGTVDGEVIVSCPHFHIERWELEEARPAQSHPRFAVFQCVTGKVRYGKRQFNPGDLFLVPAFAHKQLIEPETAGTMVLRTTLA